MNVIWGSNWRAYRKENKGKKNAMQRENSKYAQSLNTLKQKFGAILFFSSISTHIHEKLWSVCALPTHRWMYVLVNIHWIRFYSSCPAAEPLCIQHIFHNNNSTVFTIFCCFMCSLITRPPSAHRVYHIYIWLGKYNSHSIV